MNDDILDSTDYKEISLPSDGVEETWRREARLLLGEIRDSRVGVFRSPVPRQPTGAGRWLHCPLWAEGCDTLICFEGMRGKEAIRAEFEALEAHLTHTPHHAVGAAKITSAVQEPDCPDRDAIQRSIFFPDTGVVWRTRNPEPDRIGKKWLHSAEIIYEIRHELAPPQHGRIRVIHVGYSSRYAWVQFVMPHHIRPAMAFANEPWLQRQ